MIVVRKGVQSKGFYVKVAQTWAQMFVSLVS